MEDNQQILDVSNVDPGILQLTLNRPERLNALNQNLLETLHQELIKAKENPKIKAILLTGNGKAFCAGADINQLAVLNGQKGLEFAQYGQKIFRLLEQLGKPSLAAINGFALGGGCELAMSATLRMAVSQAVFGQPEIKLGVIPGFGGTQRLARLIGKGRALDICLLGRTFKAEEALSWGLISEIVDADKLIKRAKEILFQIIKLSPIALKSLMTVIDYGYDLPLEEAFAFEAVHFGLCCSSADKQEGVSAFLEKREAHFLGE